MALALRPLDCFALRLEGLQHMVRMILDAWLKSNGSTSAQQTIDAANLVNGEIRRIRRDPDLTPDEQHLQIKTLLDTLPQMLRNLRPHDV